MAKLFSIGVHSSVGMRKREYYFIYKGIQCKYVPGHARAETDNFTGKFERNTSTDDECYHVLTEFLSAFAFERDAQVIPEPGSSTDLDCSLAEYSGGFAARRRVPVQEIMEEFYYVPPLRTTEQATLARLYREARSSESVYLSLLFYWHCMVYPSPDDRTAVAFIDKLCANTPDELGFVSESIHRLLNNPIFTPGRVSAASLGEYIREGVRNSIAHIVRNRANSRNLEVDLLSELQHLNDANDVLRHFSRHRLESVYGLGEPHDLHVFRYFDPLAPP